MESRLINGIRSESHKLTDFLLYSLYDREIHMEGAFSFFTKASPVSSPSSQVTKRNYTISCFTLTATATQVDDLPLFEEPIFSENIISQISNKVKDFFYVHFQNSNINNYQQIKSNTCHKMSARW
ncbi:unnamed protein product [Orchesella dallaii]|uniref:Uncharacterized protein n=1 Tax=Orchesella dallaii TaxID=48710 RepID=A0ABP1RUP2_9HEXA